MSMASASTSPARLGANIRLRPAQRVLDAIHQDPVISQVKLIAEPWDIGEGGYQVGRFPVIWSEWNDKFRDATRVVLEREQQGHRRDGVPAHRLIRHLRSVRAGAAGQRQPRYRA